jgi:hypothetical protein
MPEQKLAEKGICITGNLLFPMVQGKYPEAIELKNIC